MKFVRTKENRFKVYHMRIYDSCYQLVGWAVASTKFLASTISTIMKDGYIVNITCVRYFDQECKTIEIHSK